MMDELQRYPMILRRGQAIEVCRLLGGSERTLRTLVKHKRITRHQLFGGTQWRYVRDEIVAQFQAQAQASIHLPS